jgi:hypothetical protein
VLFIQAEHVRRIEVAEQSWSVRVADTESQQVSDNTTVISESAKLVDSFLGIFQATSDISESHALAAALLVPQKSGFVGHSEIFTQRLAGCQLFSHIRSFLEPLAEVKAVKLVDGSSFPTLQQAISASVGVVATEAALLASNPTQVIDELRRRLTLQWCFSEPLARKRVIVIVGYENLDATKRRWSALAALGIAVVVLSTGNWWDDNHGKYHELREQFIPFDMTPDEGLSKRIVDAIRAYPLPVDGLYAPSNDPLLLPAARAAEELGLWTLSSKALTISTNKYLTSQLFESTASRVCIVKTVAELEQRIDGLSFPVIGKPSCGRFSEGVFRADTSSQLREKASRTLNDFDATNGLLIEPFCDGPEVDANLILLQGELLYSEVVDDFPSPGDLLSGDAAGSFMDTQAVIPSRLPSAEQSAIIDTMRVVIAKQGFHTGVFHCEARMQGSSMAYVLKPDSVVPDLEYVKQKSTASPEVFLHEVNARAPGFMSSAISYFAQGIDFWALSVLCTINDWTRFKALAQPFLPKPQHEHAILDVVVIPVRPTLLRRTFPQRSGDNWHYAVIDSQNDPLPALLKENPDLAPCVMQNYAYVFSSKPFGSRDDTWDWTACVVVKSSKSREHAIETSSRLLGLYKSHVLEQDQEAAQ